MGPDILDHSNNSLHKDMTKKNCCKFNLGLDSEVQFQKKSITICMKKQQEFFHYWFVWWKLWMANLVFYIFLIVL